MLVFVLVDVFLRFDRKESSDVGRGAGRRSRLALAVSSVVIVTTYVARSVDTVVADNGRLPDVGEVTAGVRSPAPVGRRTLLSAAAVAHVSAVNTSTSGSRHRGHLPCLVTSELQHC